MTSQLVLILVLMEDALVLLRASSKRLIITVLILVLMEDALVPGISRIFTTNIKLS